MIKLAIDMGSSMTKIYRADTNSGIVLAEPSCVAVVTGEQIKAIGKEAKSLIGKTAEFTVGCGYSATVNCGGTRLNVRSGPGKSYGTVDAFYEGTRIVAVDIESYGDWVMC